MENFIRLKMDRAIWVALIEKREILEAIKYFNYYLGSLVALKEKYPELKESIEEEISYSSELFSARMLSFADEFFAEKKYGDALICYAEAYKLNPNDIHCTENYITCLDNLGQYDLELMVVEQLRKINNDDKETLRLLARIYYNIQEEGKAIEYYEKYLSLKDIITADEYNLLGCYYNKYYSDKTHKMEDLQKSLKNFEIASDMSPKTAIFAKNATIMAGKCNDFESGRKHWNRLLDINNLTNDDKYDYAAFCLKTGDFEGWRKYFDARFKKEHNTTYLPKINKPRWDGVKKITNSTLLVYCEQGFGDTFLMWGYFPRIKNLAKHIIYVVQNEIYDLLKDNDLGIEIIAKKDANLDKIKFDYYIPAMSIPIALKLNRENISVGEGYIKADKELVDKYKNTYFNNDKLKIGISFAGNRTGNKTRDISLDKFLPLDELDNVEIYSLIVGVPDSDFDIFKKHKVCNIAKNFTNFADTAAAIENCDIIITSDNCILNLAGAIGKKTYGLFNKTYEFRYFDLTGDNVVWYTSVKPFMCDDIDHWEYAMDNVIKEIKTCKK